MGMWETRGYASSPHALFLKICLLIFGCAVFVAMSGLSLVAMCRLTAVVSLVVEHRL